MTIEVEQGELDGLAVWVAVAPFPFTVADMVTVAAMLPEGAQCFSMEQDGEHVYTLWVDHQVIPIG